jgi:sensor histidine kinase YesM
VSSLPVTYLTIAMVSDCLFYYIWLHLQFVKKYEASLMKEQQIDMMMSQIKPHFLYNTLTTIQALCIMDPKGAADLTQNFAKYLRRNMNILSSNELIPVLREIEHTRIYCDIEKVRFSNIDVKYDIEDSDFELPALTIQPMVENAIKHGIRGKQDGLVEVVTEKIDGFHKIVIRDNGKGFDSDKPINEEEHIGLANVKSRVEKRCNGTFTIKSKQDEGCEVTILIQE